MKQYSLNFFSWQVPQFFETKNCEFFETKNCAQSSKKMFMSLKLYTNLVLYKVYTPNVLFPAIC